MTSDRYNENCPSTPKCWEGLCVCRGLPHITGIPDQVPAMIIDVQNSPIMLLPPEQAPRHRHLTFEGNCDDECVDGIDAHPDTAVCINGRVHGPCGEWWCDGACVDWWACKCGCHRGG